MLFTMLANYNITICEGYKICLFITKIALSTTAEIIFPSDFEMHLILLKLQFETVTLLLPLQHVYE